MDIERIKNSIRNVPDSPKPGIQFKDIIEIHKDAIHKEDHVLIVDDLLATGGTAKATGSLVDKLGGTIVSYAFLIELEELKGTELVQPVFSMIKF